ncbi:MAG TPA: hypothetical protein VK002_04925 [Rubricoccaceae bacterium]|nr:hypothetical protein [Rubricoccaceae bacterium]
MRTVVATAVLAAALALAAPARAQLRADLPGGPAPVAVYETPGALSLAQLFNARTLRIDHSYEFSYSSFAGGGLGLGVYTTSLGWQPTDRLAARVDVGVAHSPFGDGALRSALGFDQDTPARVFLRNAEVAYRPTENSMLRLQVQQSPFGPYASPYGYAGYGLAPYGGFGMHAGYGTADALFWRNGE